MNIKQKNGFTLIELIIVLTIISFLLTIIFWALRPLERFSQARNSQRWAEINSLLNAVLNYRVDNQGKFPQGITTDWQVLGTATSNCSICGSNAVACLDLSSSLSKKYIGVVPFDPLNGSDEITYYAIKKTSEDNVQVKACSAELQEIIELIR